MTVWLSQFKVVGMDAREKIIVHFVTCERVKHDYREETHVLKPMYKFSLNSGLLAVLS